jgi:hypothetical protein
MNQALLDQLRQIRNLKAITPADARLHPDFWEHLDALLALEALADKRSTP